MAMGKKKLNKRARTRGGLVFSSLSDIRKGVINWISKTEGRDVFHDIHHPIWKDLIKKDQDIREAIDGCEAPFLAYTDFRLTFKIGAAKYHSIYVDSDAVLDFLETSDVRQSDGPLIRQAAVDIEDKSGGSGLVIHLPNRRESIFVTAEIDSAISNRLMVMYTRGDDIGYTPINTDGTWNDDVVNEHLIEKDWRIIFNLFLYMDAFPDCVVEGPPELVAGTSDGEGQVSIRASGVIQDVFNRSKVAPHMRRGHFRVLRSERYTHKRFQAVYVRPAMIMGKAETVLEYS